MRAITSWSADGMPAAGAGSASSSASLRAIMATGVGEHPPPQPLDAQVVHAQRLVPPEVEHGDDVLVRELARDARRAQEAPRLDGVLRQVLPEHLERHRLAEHLMARAEDERGAAR